MAKTRRLFIAGFLSFLLLPLLLFGGLAAAVLTGHRLPFDDPILRWLHALATPARDCWVVALTQTGAPSSVLFFEACVIVGLLVARKRRQAEFVALAGVGAALLNVLAKLTFSRARPQLWETIVTETSFSFPSGHSIGSMSLALAMSLLAWPTRWRWPVTAAALSFALAIGLSRIYLGVHYPSDVAAGWCAAVVWVGAVYRLQHWWINRSKTYETPQPKS